MEAEAPDAATERRRERRYAVKLEAKIQVPLSETGTGCLMAKATIEDLSLLTNTEPAESKRLAEFLRHLAESV